MRKIFIQHAHTIKMANEICDEACTDTLAFIKQLAMTRSSIYEYIDLGVK